MPAPTRSSTGCGRSWRRIQGITLYMQAAQDITIGARLSKTQYQYTLTDADFERAQSLVGDLSRQDARHSRHHRRRHRPGTMPARMLDITVNREVASSFGILPSTIDNTLDDAFGQRIVSTMYTPLNQYHVILEVDPRFQYEPEALQRHLSSTRRAASRCRSARWSTATSSRRRSSVNHQGQFPSVTISFNLRARHGARRRGHRHPADRAADRQAGLARDQLPGQRPGLPGVAVEHADPDRGGADRDLHHPRRALRERDPSDHDPVDPAVGRHRRACCC